MSDLPNDLSTLEVALRSLSHDEQAVLLVRSFAERLGKTKQRQQVFNAPDALIKLALTLLDTGLQLDFPKVI